MKLVLLSSDDKRTNKDVNEVIRPLLKGRRLTYIPSCSSGCQPYYRATGRYLEYLGVKKISLFAHETGSRAEAAEAFKSEAIFLSGGNTFYFLKCLKDKKLLPRLRKFVEKGGLLIGVSAGSIMMTPAIHTAALPSYAPDVNEVGLEDLAGLSLVPFDFAPHADFSVRYEEEMCAYTRESGRLLFACGDGGAIIFDGSKTAMVGPLKAFSQGETVLDLLKFE